MEKDQIKKKRNQEIVLNGDTIKSDLHKITDTERFVESNTYKDRIVNINNTSSH